MFSSIFSEVFCRPWQIHYRQCRSDGGQEAEDIILFTQKSREGTGDDVGGWVVQEIEVRAQRLVEKIDGQGGAEQKGQYLRHSAGAGAVAAHDEKDRVKHQQGVDGDRVQVDERPPRRHIQPAWAEQGQRRAGDAEGIKFLLAPVLVEQGVVQADEDIDAAQVEREIAPIPLASQGHAEQKGHFVKKQKYRDPYQDAPPLFWPAVPVPERSTQDEDQ